MTSKNFTGTFAHFSTRRNWAVPSWLVALVASFRESWSYGRREVDQVAYRAICR